MLMLLGSTSSCQSWRLDYKNENLTFLGCWVEKNCRFFQQIFVKYNIRLKTKDVETYFFHILSSPFDKPWKDILFQNLPKQKVIVKFEGAEPFLSCVGQKNDEMTTTIATRSSSFVIQ